jgi:predicted GIY-YIG superfamily endonuclease
MNKYPITQEKKKNEETTIKIILNNNNYPLNIIHQKQKPQKKNTGKKKWVTFTFFGPEIRTITKLFKNTEIGISYRMRNNIKHLLRIKENKGKCYQSGVYQLQCADCPKKYIGQTGRKFETRFKEHIRDIRNNGQNSRFAQHILDTGHEYETIEKTMKILHIEKKGQMLDTHERFCIYEISKQNLQLNDNYAEIYNPI